MTGQTKRRKVPGELREVLAQNINRLMEQRYQESANRPLALAEDAGVSLSSVQRTLSRQVGASIDTVEAFARVFKLTPFQLLVPWGLLGNMTAEQEKMLPKREPMVRGRFKGVPKSKFRERRRRNME